MDADFESAREEARILIGRFASWYMRYIRRAVLTSLLARVNLCGSTGCVRDLCRGVSTTIALRSKSRASAREASLLFFRTTAFLIAIDVSNRLRTYLVFFFFPEGVLVTTIHVFSWYT